jgi:uncharacterized protein (DUF1330 family)|tara:strand:+ start:85 stop:372 length:288 start_codon:yes stop_codon:yes gene_type:complete
MKGYWIAVYKDLKNNENIKKYADKASLGIKKYHGKILVRGGRTETIEGTPSPRTVVIEFPSVEEALKCYRSVEYQEAMKIGKGEFNRHIQIVEGV